MGKKEMKGRKSTDVEYSGSSKPGTSNIPVQKSFHQAVLAFWRRRLPAQDVEPDFSIASGFSCGRVCESDEDDKPSIQRIGENVQEQGSSKDCEPSNISFKKQIDNRRGKSLSLLTQNFVKLFLCTNAKMVSLDEAARLLLGDASNPAQMRNNSATKVRRVYDIANVLSSMNLIEKVHQTDTRKPAFRWLGINGKPDSDLVPCDKTLNVRQVEFGTDITNIDFKRTKMLSPIDEKAIKVPINCEASGQDDPMQQEKGSRGYVYCPIGPVPSTEGKDKEQEQTGKRVQNRENLASAFRPRYHNQGEGSG
ncbi:E2F transcription factor-like E2FE [Aristolochia californica]|uniref:E2F transcription factor-like E2FE n=1 Tax=Aristolochia californica TaxID=171875 RepID=UPI0035D5F8C8